MEIAVSGQVVLIYKFRSFGYLVDANFCPLAIVHNSANSPGSLCSWYTFRVAILKKDCAILVVNDFPHSLYRRISGGRIV